MIKTRVRQYVYTARDKEKGWIEGWRPADVTLKTFYPGPGFLAVHDAIEHLCNNTDFEHEARAFGVTLYGRIRVEPGMAENAGNDMGNFMRMRYKDGSLVKLRTPPERWMNHKLGPVAEEGLMRLLHKTEHIYFSEDVLGILYVPREHVSRREREDFAVAIKKMEGWIRLGYANAQRVYGKGRAEKLFGLIFDLSKRIDIEHDSVRPVPGDLMTITVDTKALTAEVTWEDGPNHAREKEKQKRELQSLDQRIRELVNGQELFFSRFDD